MSLGGDDLSSIAAWSADGDSSDDGAIVEEKTFEFFKKYCLSNEDGETIEENVDGVDITILQSHILDSIVTLLRIQSFQSKAVVAGNRLKNKLFNQVVNKLLNPNDDSVDSFQSV